MLIVFLNVQYFNILQPPFNTVTYEIVGDDTAQSFFVIDEFTGAITLRQSVNGDPVTEYKVRNICCYDL